MTTITRFAALDATGPQPSRVVAPAILEGRDLRKRFGTTDALRGVDLALARGEVVAVMGPSGSGKSTLLHCLAGILAPDGGSVVYDGSAIERLGEGERSRLRRTAFGFVFQFGQLVPELTALENVALPLLLNGERRQHAEAAGAEWFPRLGLAGKEGRRPGELSGGEAQRVAIARALVTRPGVIFADEPTGALDSLAGEHVMELLTSLAAEERAAVLLVTHEPRVAAYAHREVVVRDGRISGGSGAPDAGAAAPRPVGATGTGRTTGRASGARA